MEKRNNNLVTIVATVLVLLLLCVISYGFLTGRIFISSDNSSSDVMDAITLAKSRIDIGDSRENAVNSLSDAWFHSECRRTDEGPIEDIFFYGPRDPGKVEIVVVRSHENHGIITVNFVGRIENYMLHLYDHCVPNPAQAFGES